MPTALTSSRKRNVVRLTPSPSSIPCRRFRRWQISFGLMFPAESHRELFHQIESRRDNENRDGRGREHSNYHDRTQDAPRRRARA